MSWAVTLDAITDDSGNPIARANPKQVVHFRGRIIRNGAGRPNLQIVIRYQTFQQTLLDRFGNDVVGLSGGGGYFDIPWEVTFTQLVGTTLVRLPCSLHDFTAWTIVAESNVRSMWVAWRTEFFSDVLGGTLLRDTPPLLVMPNTPFTISGFLGYETADGVWAPLAGVAVSLYFEDVWVVDSVTDLSGYFSITHTIATSGACELRYAGT